jgi:hypothetical protein
MRKAKQQFDAQHKRGTASWLFEGGGGGEKVGIYILKKFYLQLQIPNFFSIKYLSSKFKKNVL